MVGGTVGEIVKSRNPKYAVGDIVLGYGGWQDYALSNGAGLAQARSGGCAGLDRARRPRHAGHDRLCRSARNRPAEARRDGRRCGGLRRGRIGRRADRQDQRMPRGRHRRRRGEVPLRRRRARLRCLRRSSRADFAKQLEAACPKGIDVYFENVGGAVQQTVWPLLNDFARIPVCGLIAQYNATTPMPGPDMFSVLRKRLLLRGFIVSDFAAKQGDFLRDVGEWVRTGRIKYREDIVDGLEKAPASFLGLLQGKNFGKMLVRMAT